MLALVPASKVVAGFAETEAEKRAEHSDHVMAEKNWGRIRRRGLIAAVVMCILLATLPTRLNTHSALAADPPGLVWSRTLGGPDDDIGCSVRLTADGGYVVAGQTWSAATGSNDVLIVKTDALGIEQWRKTFDRFLSDDLANSVWETADGGYVIVGSSDSHITPADAWLIKLDSSGEKQWDKTFGGSGVDAGMFVQQTADGGYVMAGSTWSAVTASYDSWLVKTDASGSKQWEKTFGGSGPDDTYSVQQTTDGGYVLAGRTGSSGAGGYDLWLVKTDASGDRQWDKTFGGPGFDVAYSVQQTADGGYVVAGDTCPAHSPMGAFWLIKTDASGNKQWDRTFGGPELDSCGSVRQTADGGYVLAGGTRSYGAGKDDVWLIKTDASGDEQWEKTFGGTGDDYGAAVQQTAEGAYVVAGFTDSYGAGGTDIYLIKTTAPPSVTTASATELASVSATLNGCLAMLSTAASDNVSFEWGLTTSYGNNTALQTRTITGAFSDNVTNLMPGTTYHFRALAVGDGTTHGDDQTFTTLPPAAVTASTDSSPAGGTSGLAPIVENLATDQGRGGQDLTVTISGSNLTGTISVGFGPDIAVNDFRVVSDTEITVKINIASGAKAGGRDVTVTTPQGTGTAPAAFAVASTGSRVHLWVYPVAVAGGLVVVGMVGSVVLWMRRRSVG